MIKNVYWFDVYKAMHRAIFL